MPPSPQKPGSKRGRCGSPVWPQRRVPQRFGQQQPRLVEREQRHVDGPHADQVRRPRCVGQFGDIVAAGQHPGDPPVRLDRIPQGGQQVFGERAGADLQIERLVFVHGQQQPLAALVEPLIHAAEPREQIGQPRRLDRRQFQIAAGVLNRLGDQPQQRLQGRERFGILHRQRGDADPVGQKGRQVLQHGRFADSPPPVQDQSGAAGAEHDLAFDFADDLVPLDKRLLAAVDRVAARKTGACGSWPTPCGLRPIGARPGPAKPATPCGIRWPAVRGNRRSCLETR